MLACLACGSARVQPWAKASDEEYCTTAAQYSYVRCDDCAALSIDPVPRDSLAKIYPPNYYSFDGQFTRSLLFRIKDWLDQRFFRRFIAPLPQRTLSVLDVGGGAGTQLSSFKEIDRRIDYTAIVDIDEKAQEVARQRGHDYFCGRFEDYPGQRTFDVILMLNLIEHVDNPRALLEKARTLLSPDGLLIVKTPNTDSLDARLFRHHNWGGYHCPRHWVLFDRKNFCALVEQSGLRIRQFHYTQGAPFWATSVLFWMNRRGWIHISRERPAPAHPLYPLLNAAFAGFDLMRGLFMKTSQMFAIIDKR
jgi:2-polyprenyl-3-methyl-5-hydroxy-6-metoxy-1,4-benzoquinol methylase